MRFYLVGVVFCGIYTAVYCLPNAARKSQQDDKYLDLVRMIADEVLQENAAKNDPPYNNRNEGYVDSSNTHATRNDQRYKVPPYNNRAESYLNSANTQARGNDQRLNDPPYITRNEGYLDSANTQARADGQRLNVPPYITRNKGYLDSANTEAKENDQILNEPSYTDREEKYLQIARKVADQYMEDTRARYQGSEQTSAQSASAALRAFNRPSRRTQRIAEQNERETAELETLLLLATEDTADGPERRLQVDLNARSARKDRSCTEIVNCNNNNNLNIVDEIEFRTIDGTCNNKKNFTWGMAGAQHRRLLPDAYRNGRWAIRDTGVNRQPLPHPRNISNVVHRAQNPKSNNDDSISLALFYFMQFIDHDLAKTPDGQVRPDKDCCESDGGYCMPIKIDSDDDPRFAKGYCMDARRSLTLFRCNDDSRFQNQLNEITSYLDGSMIYGSSAEEGELLRDCLYGLMKESTGGFLPFSERASHLPCNMTKINSGTGEQCRVCYEAGDTRANVHPGLLSYHTIFVREHNRIARKLADLHRDWSGERIYQETRRIIGAMLQHIVYEDMLPLLLSKAERDKHGITDSYKYDVTIDASMTQAFSMGYRYHNIMPHELHLAGPVSNGATNFKAIRQELAIQRPNYVADNGFRGIEEVALGMVVTSCPYVDRLMNLATADFLFLDINGSSFDLAVLNIMRGREWGMPPYTEYRALCGLGNATTWEHLNSTTDQKDIDKMKDVYSDVRDVDFWTGIMTERKLPGTISGATQHCLLAMHFANLKHGDRFWYERSEDEGGFKPNQLTQIKQKTSLARILCDNLDVAKMRLNVFRTDSPWITCDQIREQSGGEWDFEEW